MPLKTIGRPADAEGLEFFLDPSLVLYLPLWKRDGSSIISEDAYGHLCMVTGALWHPIYGRWFDKIDDLINCGSAASIDNIFDGGGSIEVWINPASDGEGDLARIFSKGVWYFHIELEAAGKVKIDFVQGFSTTAGGWRSTSTEISINTYSHVVLTYNSGAVANDPIIYVNGVSVALTEYATPVGTRTTDAAADLIIGNASGGNLTWDGYIPEVKGYKARILTPGEVMNNYLATKWRY